jgi:Zn ribbon nucleic-acid-binding protein
LNAKIRKEIEENEGSFVWRERRVELADCVEQKNRSKIGNAWERKYDEFKRCVGMPKKGTPLHNWQGKQLRNGASSLNVKIRKEEAENKGSTVWRERRVELADCVAQKRRE